MLHQQQFPGYLTEAEEDKLSAAGLLYYRSSDGATLPLWSDVPASQRAMLLLGTDHPDQAQRECHQGKRFGVFLDDGGDQLFESDNLDEAIAAYWRYTAEHTAKLLNADKAELYRTLKWAMIYAEKGHEACYPGETYEKDGYVADSMADARAVLARHKPSKN